ncbi:hypothetical protein ColTof4_09317 [Colletotrichum tofieldiae]|nr:hypothetical protein ColTof3_12601 [Colletotrichum tofieldiae]GKT76894.1 hypothetical protein ColTof4_09317 [Colletotrichum tofieldiae]GKT92660.1 hypothetical protein Ct61P_10510 [Colletotrichum tofieldiae]
MAESLAALGVAANIVQFLELGFKVTRSIVATYRSTHADGLAERNVELEASATSLKLQCIQLQNEAGLRVDGVMMGLLMRCIDTATQLLDEIDALKMSPANRQERWARLLMSAKAHRKKKKIADLQAKMVEIKTIVFQKLQVLLL